jgi:hypothetical protein
MAQTKLAIIMQKIIIISKSNSPVFPQGFPYPPLNLHIEIIKIMEKVRNQYAEGETLLIIVIIGKFEYYVKGSILSWGCQ